MINDIPVSVQLPPEHQSLLKFDADETSPEADRRPDDLELADEDHEDSEGRVEDELRFGWRIPPLRPWKSVLILDGPSSPDPLPTPGSKPEDKMNDPVGSLDKFLAIASPTLSYVLFSLPRGIY